MGTLYHSCADALVGLGEATAVDHARAGDGNISEALPPDEAVMEEGEGEGLERIIIIKDKDIENNANKKQ